MPSLGRLQVGRGVGVSDGSEGKVHVAVREQDVGYVIIFAFGDETVEWVGVARVGGELVEDAVAGYLQ